MNGPTALPPAKVLVVDGEEELSLRIEAVLRRVRNIDEEPHRLP